MLQIKSTFVWFKEVCTPIMTSLTYIFSWHCTTQQTNETLTLTLLTWKIWWAPNNASKGQMRFNSAFKGLMYQAQFLSEKKPGQGRKANIWCSTLKRIFTYIPCCCIVILSKFFIHRLMHQRIVLKTILKIYIKTDIKTAPTCFGAVTPSSGSALFVLAKVTVAKIVS
jgi:hypothetical protein